MFKNLLLKHGSNITIMKKIKLKTIVTILYFKNNSSKISNSKSNNSTHIDNNN